MHGVATEFAAIWAVPGNRKLVIYVVALFFTMLLEMGYGVSVGSLSLVTDAFHMMFNCVALVIALIAMVLSKRGPTLQYTFGYGRHEILAAYANSVFMLLISLFMVLECVHRMWEPVAIEGDKLLYIGLLGLGVNVAGAVSMSVSKVWLGRATASEQAAASGHQVNLDTAYLLVAVDTASSVGVIINALLVELHESVTADPLLALFIGLFTVYSVVPVLRQTSGILLQTAPAQLKAALEKCHREAMTVEGVLECNDEHYWTQSPGCIVGSMRVRVQGDANEQRVVQSVHRIFARYIHQLTIQVDKDPSLDWLLASSTPRQAQ